MKITALLSATLRSGTIASLVIVPLAPLFGWMGLRIGHYGPKFAALFVDHPQRWMLVAQHMVIGWISAIPLLWMLAATRAGRRPLTSGAVYGTVYYIAVNALALPFYFGDPTPWELGWSTVLPSLIGHVMYGASVALTSRRFISDWGHARCRRREI